ncbi:MAG: DNA mismatch repair endonuclease MutL [Nanobdellota archaeon]
MVRIKKLHDELIGKIAAGEVIERPASVVKELVENSIDAGSDRITVETEEAGAKLIRVKDNGPGMDEEDLRNSIKRHTTSKIKDEEDLYSINSLGFRGEALASIASVSKLRIRTGRDEPGKELIYEGQDKEEINDITPPEGTIIEVNDLFHNTPARKKYMKSRATEASKISDIVTRYSLNYPSVHIKLIHNGKTVIDSPSTDSMLNNLVSLYGKDICRNLLDVNHESGKIRVKGYISRPELTRKTRDYQTLFVNGRYVKNKAITDAVYEAYGSLLFHGTNPVFVLDIRLDPEEVDVNVHPSKMEIKLSHDDLIKYTVKKAISERLEKEEHIPEIKEEPQRTLSVNEEKETRNYRFETERQQELRPEISGPSESKPREEEKTSTKTDDFIIHGQVDKTYILAEDEKGLLIIDQHAAEERINFERFLSEKENIPEQELVEPVTLEVTAKEAEKIKSMMDDISKLGFGIEEFGINTFIIRRAPEVLSEQKTKTFIHELLEENLDELTYDKIATKACRSSVKAGEEKTHSAMKDTLKRLKKCENPYTCPHGRPTMLRYTIKELEKMFKRVV